MGICRVIPPSTYSVTMEKPYKGLAKAEYFRNNDDGYSIENIKGRAQWELGRLYEQFQGILYEYDKYKRLWTEWKQYDSQLQTLIEETIALKEEADAETLAFLDLHIGMLKRDVIERFYELMENTELSHYHFLHPFWKHQSDLLKKNFVTECYESIIEEKHGRYELGW